MADMPVVCKTGFQLRADQESFFGIPASVTRKVILDGALRVISLPPREGILKSGRRCATGVSSVTRPESTVWAKSVAAARRVMAPSLSPQQLEIQERLQTAERSIRPSARALGSFSVNHSATGDC